MKKDDQISFASNRQTVQKFKIVMVGDQNAGKSSIIIRYVKNDFQKTNNPTIGIDFTSKNLVIRDRTIRLQLWDTAGQERFRSLIPSYLKDCNLAIVVYDVTSENALDNLQKWIDFVKQARGSEAKLCIAANKIDLQCEIKEEIRVTVQRMAKQQTLTGKNVHEIFQQFAQQILKSTNTQSTNNQAKEGTSLESQAPQKQTNQVISLKHNQQKKLAPKSGCC